MNVTADEPGMSKREQKLLIPATQGAPVRLILRTGVRVDTGRWWRRSPLWLCVTDDEMILFAAARRRYVERLSLADARGSWYCHSTGQLMIEPHDNLRFDRLNLSPSEALRVLACLEESPVSASDSPMIATENSRA